MKRNRLLTVLGGGFSLPYSLDFSTLPDGPLPGRLVGSTWTIASGAAINTPVPGTELLTDPGLEATYTAGLCASLTKVGSPTVAESADAHGGSKAQAFTGAAANNTLYQQIATPLAGRWYLASVWGKRASGTSGNVLLENSQNSGLTTIAGYGPVLDDAAYTQISRSFITKGTGNLFIYPAQEVGAAAFDAVIVDDMSLKYLTTSELMATVNAGRTDLTIKLRGSMAAAPQRPLGIVARLDSTAAPANYLLAYKILYRATGWLYVGLMEVVNSVPASLIDPTYVAAADSTAQDLEIRMSGATVSLWWNNVQAGTNQTTNVTTGTRVGMFGTGGGNSVNRFFVV